MKQSIVPLILWLLVRDVLIAIPTLVLFEMFLLLIMTTFNEFLKIFIYLLLLPYV